MEQQRDAGDAKKKREAKYARVRLEMMHVLVTHREADAYVDSTRGRVPLSAICLLELCGDV